MERFDTVSDEPEWEPRYNIAPTQPVAVIRQNPREPIRELSFMRWGLVPSWAKNLSGAEHDQRQVRDREHKACVRGSPQASPLPDSCRWILRMETSWNVKAALLL